MTFKNLLNSSDDAEEQSAGPESCYGFSVRSGLTFQFTRPGGQDPLEITEASGDHPLPTGEPLLAWEQAPGRPFARFFSHDDDYSLWIDQVGWFFVHPAGRAIQVPKHADPLRREVRLWSLPAALCLVERGDVSLHGAAIDVGGTALVFAAPGKHGKTTLASAFLQAGHRLLSEDLTCCRPWETPSVLPGPAVMRVRRDSFAQLEFPGTNQVAEDPDRVYLSVDESLRGDARPVPIGGIIFLRRSDREMSMERVSFSDALRDLWALSFSLPTDESKRRCFGGITPLAESVPVWNLYREFRFDNLSSVVDRIVSTCLE
jgi:hypothetical protein